MKAQPNKLIPLPQTAGMISFRNERRVVMMLEGKLWADASSFLRKKQSGYLLTPERNNLSSIVANLTGIKWEIGKKGLLEVIDEVDRRLSAERKRARLNRHDYSLDRHIALHQCKKRLEAYGT